MTSIRDKLGNAPDRSGRFLWGRATSVCLDDILCGTSVGALNACGLAAYAHEGKDAARRLIDVWTKLQISELVQTDMRGMLGFGRRLLGRGGAATDVALRLLAASKSACRLVASDAPLRLLLAPEFRLRLLAADSTLRRIVADSSSTIESATLRIRPAALSCQTLLL